MLELGLGHFATDLANARNFWNRSTFLKKHQILSTEKFKESFSGNSVKLSDFRVFSSFETLPGCLAYSHIEIQNMKLEQTTAYSCIDHVWNKYSISTILSKLKLYFKNNTNIGSILEVLVCDQVLPGNGNKARAVAEQLTQTKQNDNNKCISHR